MGYMNEFPHTRMFDSDLREILEIFNAVKGLPSQWEEFRNQMAEDWSELKNFVNNYFEDLDVQQEINNKIDGLVADGTIESILKPLFFTYRQEIDAEINQLKNRMDTFSALPDGSTAGDAELEDIRVPANGFNSGNPYSSAGNAVRGQASWLLSSEYDYADRYHSNNLFNCVNENDPDFLVGYGFQTTTSNIVASEESSITGFIRVAKGKKVTGVLNNGLHTFFTNDFGISTGMKVAIYDANKTWIRTVDLGETPYAENSVDFGIDGYIRLAYRHFWSLTIYNELYSKIREFDDFNVKAYGSGYEANLVNIDSPDYLRGYGFSGETSQIVETDSYNITNFIPIHNGVTISAYVVTPKYGTYGFFTNPNARVSKLIMYNKNKEWMYTRNLQDNPMDSNEVDFGYDGFIRLQCNPTDVLFVSNENLDYFAQAYVEPNKFDIMIFMGQSNMAGRGINSSTFPDNAPNPLLYSGYEYRAITAPNTLYAITPTFGVDENVVGAIDDEAKKIGGMVPSFVNAYYKGTKRSIIGVSASDGGTSTSEWMPGTSRFTDAVDRLTKCINFCTEKNIPYEHIYMVWCQGEGDAGDGVSGDVYNANLITIVEGMMTAGVEKCFLCRIGESNANDGKDFTEIIEAQTELAKDNPNIIMVSTNLAGMKARGLMKDSYHYYQQGYNEMGEQAGCNAAFYVNTGKEPVMYDPKFNNLYYSHLS